MSGAIPIVKTLLILTLTGLSLFRLAPRAIREIHSWTDRLLLSLLTGIAFYTLFFLVAQGLFHLPLNPTSLTLVFALILAAGVGVEIRRRFRDSAAGFEESPVPEESGDTYLSTERKVAREIFIVIALGLLFVFSLDIRVRNQMAFPGRLLDADPYRHHIRTEALLETGYLSKFDPYYVGEVPIFELQGCYILTGVLGLAGPFSSQQLWMWGSQVFGALSILSLYLFTKLGLRSILALDLGPPTRKQREGLRRYLHPETAATVLGLIAAGLWGASPVHILRTNAGFSEAYAIPMLAPALLFYLWAAQSRIWGDFVWFGVFFTALAFINPVPAVFIVPFLAVHASYVFYKTRDKRWIYGHLLAGGIFFVCLMVWNWKFLATPLLTGLSATSEPTTNSLRKAMGEAPSILQKLAAGWNTFSKDITRNLNFLNFRSWFFAWFFAGTGTWAKFAPWFFDKIAIAGAFAGSFWMLWDRREKKWRWGVDTSFFFLSYAFFFFILFLIPFGFISFTSKYYRYLLPISLSLSVLFAYFIWRLILSISAKASTRIILLGAALVLATLVNFSGRTWGNWSMNCTPEEFASADWINQNTDPSDFIIANWYTGDYLRSLTKRRIIISDYPRPEVAVAISKFKLKIPILPRNTDEVVKYTQDVPGTYYLVTSKWGPWGAYDKDARFELVASFGKDRKTRSLIYRVHGTAANSETQPQ